MEYREFKCLYCGAKGIDKSKTKNRMYCDYNCQHAYYRKKRGVGVNTKTTSCIHNKEIRCLEHKCGSCGWNPKVELRRKEAMGYG